MAKNTSDDRKVFGMKADDREHADGIYANTDNININKLCRGTEDTMRTQTSQHTESERVRMRCYRSVTVCLVLLCVLLLTAVIVLCVLINTNNQPCHIKTKNLTEERDQLLTKYTNITEERDQLVLNCKNFATENERLLANNNNLNKQRVQLTQQINAMMKILKADDWKEYQSSLYFISSEKKIWSESRRYCRERGADLIIINNREEQDYIKKIGGGTLWIGLSDSDEEGKWKWVDGSTLNSRFWDTPREPNGDTGENCAVSHAPGWADYPCTHTFTWICEKTFFKNF